MYQDSSESRGPSAAAHRGKRRSERTRARLLDAARAVFLERGYDGASLSEITERADLGTGTLYLHFRDKRAVYEALVRHEVGVQREEWQRACTAGGPVDGARAIELMLRVNLDRCVREPDLARLVLCDGPAVETWLVDELGEEIAGILAAQGVQSPELAASLVVGASLSAGRMAVTRKSGPSKARLEAIAVFCAGGIAALGSARKRRHGKSRRRATRKSEDRP